MSPPSLTPLSIDDLARAARSRDPEDRIRAMQALLIRVRRDPALGAAAVRVFRRVTEYEEHGEVASLAARGVEEIEGAEAARPVWLKLLAHPSPGVPRSAAASVTDRLYLPAFMDLLERRHEPEVRGAAIRGLGRIPHESVFPAIIGFLDDPALRVYVIEALADQGDTRATPHLERLVEDETETGEYDDRGALVRVGHLAWNAIRRFNEPDLARHYAPDRYQPFRHEVWGDPVPMMLGGPPPYRFESAASVATSAPAAPKPAPAPVVTPAVPPAPPRFSRYPDITLPKVALPATFLGLRVVALVPLALAVVEVFWTVFLLAMLAEAIRIGEKTPLRGPLLDILGPIPGVLGLLAALVIPFRYSLRPREYIALVVGALACLPLVHLFVEEGLRLYR